MEFPKARLLNVGGGGGSKANRSGIVRANGRAFEDDGGVFNPLGASFFWLLWGIKHDRDRTLQNLDTLAKFGVDFIRVFGQVGGGSWADREVNPHDSDYPDVLAAALDTAWHEYGIRVELSMFAGNEVWSDRDRIVDRVLDVLQDRQDAIMYIEAGNEAFMNIGDRDGLRSVVSRFRRRFPGLVAYTNSPDGVSGFELDVANLATFHTDRAHGDEDWRQVRQPWDANGLRVPGSNNEPPGPESSVAELWDPLRLTMLRANGILCGLSSFVFHTGAGIRGGGQADRDRGRKANLWEYGDRLDQIMTPLRAVDSILPGDLSNWTKENWYWGGQPLRPDNIWPDGGDHGYVRGYGAHSGNRFVVMPFGIKRYVDLRAKDTCRVEVYDPLTLEVVKTESVNAGNNLRLEGNPREAYIVIGTT